jgi:hypothetical protein
MRTMQRSEMVQQKLSCGVLCAHAACMAEDQLHAYLFVKLL